MPDSKPAAIPGGGEMQLSEGRKSARPNPTSANYTLFRVSALLTIDAGSAIGQGRLRCEVHVPQQTLVAQTHKSRASYPRSSEELFEQDTPETSLVEFSSHSTDLASVDVSDVFGKRYTTERGIVVEWAPYKDGQQVWQAGPAERPAEGRPGTALRLDLAHHSEAGGCACPARVETGAGSATVRTAGSLSPARARRAARAPPRSLCRPCSASGWRARCPSALRRQRRAHRDRVLGARGRDAARPPRPRRSGRIAGIRSWTLATTSFGRRRDDRAAVEPAVVEAAILVVLPLLAGADAGEGERLAAVDREAPGLARLLRVLRLHPLVEAVGDDQAAVAELADQRRVGAARGRGSRLWR